MKVMNKDYIKLTKEQSERIDDFRNSLQVCNFTHKETIDYHKKWFKHIIEKGKELENIEEDLINNRK